MTGDFVVFVLGVALLLGGGDLLVRMASAVAIRLRLSPVTVGALLVGFGTSAPELAVGAEAALRSHGELAVGNVVGSNVCNVGLVLGVGVLLRPVAGERTLARFDAPFLAATSLLGALFLYDGTLTRPEAGVLLVAMAGYVAISARRGQTVLEAPEADDEAPPVRVRQLALYLAAGLAALLLGAHLVVQASIWLARDLGVSEAFIALSLIAFGTSLPELAVMWAAAFRSTSGIAVGNVVGSNLFNLLAILGTAATLRPLELGSPSLLEPALLVASALVLWALLRARRITRTHGTLLVLAYATSLALVAN